ncbi:unnamed protein product [Trichobilharzia regenti]|nr:unnamed protein product [Trichobilharzia regenti]
MSSQCKGIKPLRIYKEELESCAVDNKEVENDEVGHTNGGKMDICDNDHDSAHLSSADHDEINGMPATSELKKGSLQLEREAELKADAVAEGMDTRETVSVNDQRVGHLSTGVSAKPETIIKD